MQFFGALSMLLCTLSMASLFLGFYNFGNKTFGLSLIAMTGSLCISIWEVYISSNALNLELKDLNDKYKS